MRARRWVTHPGCTAAVLALLFLALELLGLHPAARVLGAVVAATTAGPVLAVLLVSPPLPKMHARSLLTERLAWLWKFAVGTFVLCTAGVLSVYFAHEFSRQDATVDPETRLITAAVEVGSAAAVLGAFIFLVWVVIDLGRLGAQSRVAAVAVALRKLGLPTSGGLGRWCAFVTNPWWALLVLAVVLGPGLQLMVDLGE